MEPHISSKAAGEWILIPVEPAHLFSKNSWLSYRASASTGVLDYETRETDQIELHILHLRMNSPDPLRMYFTPSNTLIFQLLGSGIFESRQHLIRAFYERSCNLVRKEEPVFYFRFPDQRTSLLLLIRFRDEFILRLDEKISLPGNSSSLFLTGKNIIMDRYLLDLLSEVLFPDYPPDWEDFILEELVRTIFQWITKKKDEGPFQPLHPEKTDIEWFEAMKQQLLAVKNKALPFQLLLKVADILQIKRFRKLLKSFYGLSILELLTEARMKEAQNLLRATDRTIKQIAADTGYKNIHYFSKIFKKYTGMPPAHFQKMNTK